MRIETEALCENAAPGYPEEAFSCAVNNELRTLFEQEVQRLPQKQAIVIRERFLCSSPWEPPSYRVLGEKLSCSHEHVRRLEAKGLENLRESLGFLGKDFDAPEDRGRRSEARSQRLVHDCVAGGKRNRLSREQYDSMTPEQRKARKRENGHRSYLKHRERKLAENKQRYEDDKVYHNWRARRWVGNNLESYRGYQREYQRQYSKRQRENMDDGYIIGLLTSGNGLTRQDIPKELVELKRIQLKLERSLERKEES